MEPTAIYTSRPAARFTPFGPIYPVRRSGDARTSTICTRVRRRYLPAHDLDWLAMDRRYRRLSKGLRCLEAWSENAAKSRRMPTTRPCSPVSNGSVSRFYRISAAPERADEFIVHVRED